MTAVRSTWRLDWFAVAAQIRPGVPVSVTIAPTPRQLAPRTLTLIPRSSGPSHWRRREGLALAATRLTQIVSLALALLVALRRPFETRARLGAWLLASIAVFCIAPRGARPRCGARSRPPSAGCCGFRI